MSIINSGNFISRVDYDFYSDLAYRWAPIHYQYVNPTDVRRDMLCSVDFDRDWDTSNNRKHLADYDYGLIPIVYYSTAETSTHYYIMYCFYHADDKTHENDLEGCLIIVEKEDRLLGMISIAHFDFFSYTFINRLQGGNETLDGDLFVEEDNGIDRPMTKQESDKHGLYAWGSNAWWQSWYPDSMKKLGIRYYPANFATVQDEYKVDSLTKTSYPYVLVDLLGNEGFWNRQNNSRTFKSWGTFNSCTSGSAHAPWVWSDCIWPWDESRNDLPAGTIFFDPALITHRYFSGFPKFDTHYIKKMDEKFYF